MAYQRPNDLDGFIGQMGKADMRIRTQLAEDLVNYLSDSENSLACSDLGALIDGLIPWLSGSHFKIAQRALEALVELINSLGQDFNAYTSSVLQHVVDRLGDSRDTVREKAQLVLNKLMECKVLAPQQLLDKLTPCFKHKNAKVREEFLQTIVNTLNEYGTQNLSVKTYIQPIVDLLSDPTPSVRDAANQALVEVYKHVGDKLRQDLRKKNVPPNKLAVLEQKFDEVKSDNLLLPSAVSAASTTTSSNAYGGFDDPDACLMPRPNRIMKRSPSAKRPIIEQMSAVHVSQNGSDMMAGSNSAGAVSVAIFEMSFENVPKLAIFGQRDTDDMIKSITKIIGDKTMDWEKRVDALKRIRSLLLYCPEMKASFAQYSKDLSISYLDILKELRSQVIREACITLAYMSKCLTTKLDSFLAYIVSELIMLVANSAKVISSSGSISLKFVLKYSPSPKLIPIITTYLTTSKSKDIRSNLCEVLGHILEEWPTRFLEKNSPLIRDALKKGLADADMDARRYSRKSYWQFRKHFPTMGDQMYNQLDLVTQKGLEKERDNDDVDNGPDSGCMTASLRGSSSSLNSMPGVPRKMASGIRTPMASPAATSASTENLAGGGGASGRLSRVPSLPRSSSRARTSGIPVSAVASHRDLQLTRGMGMGVGAGGFRSISALDTAAAQRARARVQYSTLARQKVVSGSASLQGQVAQQARSKRSMFSPTSQASPEHQRSSSAVRQTARSAGVSQSQPTSRSTSPSSRQRDPYPSYGFRGTGTIPKKTSGIPRSLANSRETSPTRTSLSGIKRNSFSNGQQPRRPPINPARPVLAQKMLLQSREAEQALSDALSPDDHDLSADYARPLRKAHRGEESDESEASSVCSERSFDRTNDSCSWNGSRTRLDSYRAPITDIEVIIQYCASTHWSERRDGLTNLTLYMSDGKVLTQNQLKCILELFRKMFLDSHTKVYALFLDTLNELILAHSDEMHDWLFILLVRLFSKLGTDLLVSMSAKIWKTLDLVYEYFPPEVQLEGVFRILTDVVQTPNSKTRVATLKFLTKLAQSYCSPNQFSARQKHADKAVSKIVQFTQDKKVKELKDQAAYCLVALYNCNPPEMTQLFSTLPKSVQDVARSVIQAIMRKSPSSSPLSCASPKLLMSPQQHLGQSSPLASAYGSAGHTNPGSPLAVNHHANNNNNNNHHHLMSSPRSRQSSMDDPMNSEEVYKSLRKTTAEIQNYSFESKLDRDATSKDSGISQMGGHAAGGDVNNGFSQYLEARVVQEMSNGLGEMHLGSASSAASSCNGGGSSKATTESNTPENTVRGLDSQSATTAGTNMGGGSGHNSSVVHSNAISYGADGQVVIDNSVMEADVVREALALNAGSDPEHVKAVLSNLAACVKFGNGEIPVKHFKGIMKMILNLFTSDNELMVKSAIYVLCKIIRSEPMRSSWMQFLELIILKIIDSYRISRDVAQRIDATIPQIAKNLPLDLTLNILYPVIATGEYPTNFAALKMLLELADKQGHLLTEQHLDTIMPCLARLTDNTCSLVRKEAVFCIVKLYVVMGEDMVKPKLTVLPASKIRLLNVYINKSQNKTSSSTTANGDPSST